MKTRSINILVTAIAVLYFFGCQKANDNCPKGRTFTDSFSNSLRQCIPYKGYDTLTFINTDIGDTHVFIGGGVIHDFGMGLRQLAEDCPYDDTTYYEYMNYKFVSSTYSYPILFSVSINESNLSGVVKVSFKGNNFYCPYIDFGSHRILTSKIIQNQVYAELFHLPLNYNDYDSSYYASYSKLSGIVQMKCNGVGELWELINFK